MVSIEICRYTDVFAVPRGLPDGSKWTLGCVYVLLCRAVRLIPVIPVISNASQEPCRYNAFSHAQTSGLLLCPSIPSLLLFHALFAWQEGQKKEFTLSFSRSFPFLPLVPEHSCRWDNIPGLCSGSGRALRCLMMGLALQHLLSFMRDVEREMKCAIMCCYNLRTQFSERDWITHKH